MDVNDLTGQVVSAALRVHSKLGPGLLENVYEACLLHELRNQGLQVQNQVVLPVVYEGTTLECGYRIDVLVNDMVIIEIKAVDAILPIHKAQLLSYLRLSNKKVGLLFNFNVVHMRDGIKRLVI